MFITKCDKCGKELRTEDHRVESIFDDYYLLHQHGIPPTQQALPIEMIIKGRRFQFCSFSCLIAAAKDLDAAIKSLPEEG